jgi:hypothetical protein
VRVPKERYHFSFAMSIGTEVALLVQGNNFIHAELIKAEWERNGALFAVAKNGLFLT